MKKIHFFVPVLKPGGGAMVMVHLACGLKNKGYDVAIAVFKGRADDISFIRGLPVIQIGIFDGRNIFKYIVNLLSIPLIAPKADYYVGVSGAFIKILELTARLRKAKAVTLVQSNDFVLLDKHEKFYNRPFLLKLIKTFMRINFKTKSKVLAVSRYVADNIENECGLKIVEIINATVDDAHFIGPKKERNFDNKDNFTIMTIGRKHKIKGTTVIVDVMRILSKEKTRKYNLIMPSIDPLELQDDLHITILPRQSANEMAVLYRDADFFVSTSTEEGFGLPPLEAMAAGASVLLTDSGGVREYIKPGENCVLLSNTSPEEIAKNIIELSVNTKLRQKFAAEGFKTAEMFRENIATDKFLAIIESL